MASRPAPTLHTPPPPRPRPVAGLDVRGLEHALRRAVEGEVRFDDGSRALYAVDASNYRQVPIGVVVPRTPDDVVATVAVCRTFGAPVLSRGGGTSLAGQCCNVAVVIDWSKYVNRILDIDPQARVARVQPGVICDDVVRAGRPHRLTYGPDPATHNHCCFGGMLGNNSCGIHAQMAGKAVDNTEAMDVLLYDGTRLSLGWMDEQALDRRARQPGRVGEIHRRLRALRDRHAATIRERYPKLLRRVSGYNLDQLLPDEHGRFNLARALVGSEGTCITILEATVRLVHNHPERVLLVLGYPDAFASADDVPEVREYEPIGLEGIDARLVHNLRAKGGPHAEYLQLLPEGGGYLLVEFGADSEDEAAACAERLMHRLGRRRHPPHMKLVRDAGEQRKIWEVRESGLGATAFVPGEPDMWPGWEDSAVPVDRLGGYLRDLRALYDRYGYHPALYGHFGMGCVHCRVGFDLRSAAGIARYRAFMDDATDLCVGYGGSLSGEHGDGQSRAEFLVKMFGRELIDAFREFKGIWDPDGRMNPGKVVDPYRIDENLRLGADYHPWEPATHFRYPEDQGSFARAALRCVGVGKCRRLDASGEQDTMCPSFMVTREEEHTTRGRAHSLWEMLHGDVLARSWRDRHVKEALDLCLACKGCKGDCPVNVDMATYKAEFLAHYWEGRLRPRYAYAFGLIDRWARLAALAPGLANLPTQLPGLRAVAKLAAGMPQAREIPAFAPETFQAWFRRRGPRNLGARRVILWPDTFNNHFLPETAEAAVDVLEAAGWQVEVPEGHFCCGRPLYDYGMLARAKQYLLANLRALAPAIDAGTPIVVLEPSCASVFRDELHGLFPDRGDARRLTAQTLLLSEFLERHAAAWQPPRLARRAIVQGHCHQKAIMRMRAEEAVLDRLGLDWTRQDSGCCGMAGAFGYEKAKYRVSIACGERVLLPAVRGADAETLIVADGFSCREQIAQTTDRHALHLAEVLRLALDGGPDGGRPEAAIVARRRAGVRRAMWRAAGGAAVALAGIAAVAVAARRHADV
jgi:FAD/FMN-containing dehydrogenase/Fe-S oxidoreductase